MVRMTRGRAWIVVLSGMLAGIVALNVINLSFNAAEGKLAQQAQILEQENSVLRARLAQRLSNGQVRSAAAALGMTAPSPTDISYRDASPNCGEPRGKASRPPPPTPRPESPPARPPGAGQGCDWSSGV